MAPLNLTAQAKQMTGYREGRWDCWTHTAQEQACSKPKSFISVTAADMQSTLCYKGQVGWWSTWNNQEPSGDASARRVQTLCHCIQHWLSPWISHHWWHAEDCPTVKKQPKNWHQRPPDATLFICQVLLDRTQDPVSMNSQTETASVHCVQLYLNTWI